ncbi:MAG: hypothetical protein E5X63_27025 [Mesorhizobium sp.]|nr:MAG: hypothetical protein E5X63_27025 [Mesorhizobium sp.]
MIDEFAALPAGRNSPSWAMANAAPLSKNRQPGWPFQQGRIRRRGRRCLSLLREADFYLSTSVSEGMSNALQTAPLP